MKTVVITGCGSGFGFGLARACLEAGYRVVATNPCVDGLRERILHDLGTDHDKHLQLATLDVRDEAAVTRLAKQLERHVDALVNNAGYAVFATQEEADLERIRDLFDVNVLGPARLTKAFLPSLRERNGVVVQLSSVAGRMTFPESGFYAATKHALEAMSHALVCEVGPLGVRVRLIQPGAFATSFYETAEQYTVTREDTSVYGEASERWLQWRQDILEEPQNPQRVVQAIVASLEDSAPYLRIPVGDDAQRILGLVEGVGQDAWIEWSMVQCGGASSSERGILSPEAVLNTSDKHVLRNTLVALCLGHLVAWERTETGRRALAHLQAINAS